MNLNSDSPPSRGRRCLFPTHVPRPWQILPALLLGLSCDTSTGPGTPSLALEELRAGPSVVCPSRSSTIMARLGVNPDADVPEVTFAWGATGGTLTGAGAAVAWNAPEAPGSYWVRVTATDTRGGTASDSVEVEVREGTLLIQTRTELLASREAGGSWVFTPEEYQFLEVLGDRIYVLEADRTILELDPLDGGVPKASITLSRTATVGFFDLLALPGKYFALANGIMDFVWVADSTGWVGDWFQFGVQEVPYETIQGFHGTFSGSTLHLCCDDDARIIAAEIGTAGYRTYPVGNLSVRAVDWGGGTFYFASSQEIVEEEASGSFRRLFVTDTESNITSLRVVGPYLYFTMNRAGKVYRTHRETGLTEVYLEGLDYPEDLECLPLALTPG